MSRTWLGVSAPLFISVVVWAVAWLTPMTPEIARGIAGGVAIALLQSLLSVGAMKWTWNTKNFYWAWGGGMFFRMAVFAVTAFFVYHGGTWSFLATMISLIVATTVFLVFESLTIFGKKRNGFSRTT